ncbi:radical SAM protein [Thioalbus denitrificans]|uniref:Radical SAM family protein n=1 Tax=Thioalbus denitrificans TaxID=547122 RepID=A0A369CFK0_9GAMM|nr:radical SAM protein [Thioalbus denitrificans]RCX32709.1 radical SAM family protein [Thioalbus denitrificans]
MNFLDFYDMPLYRPPSEGDNVIVQATLGCSFNRCTFCSMYKGKSYVERPLAEVGADIDRLAAAFPEARRVFLADGDALALPTGHLLALIAHLRERFPRLARVSSYALPANLLRKSAGELEALRAAGLTLLYYGIETGSPDLLRRIVKGATPRGMAAGLEKAAAAGMKVSATVILGLGGRRHWEHHIDATLELVNGVPLTYLSTLQLGLAPEVEAEFLERFGPDFEWQDDAGILAEQARLVAGLAPPQPVIFRSNHASNALPLAGTLPADRERLLARIEAAGAGAVGLRPRWLRGY